MSIFSAPLRAFLFIVDEVIDRAESVQYGEEELRAALRDLHAAMDEGSLTDDEFERREEALVRRLAEAQRRNRHRSRER